MGPDGDPAVYPLVVIPIVALRVRVAVTSEHCRRRWASHGLPVGSSSCSDYPVVSAAGCICPCLLVSEVGHMFRCLTSYAIMVVALAKTSSH